jgi:radical SAM superfamily enzyme YgiQ (UPF0313 family)
MANLGFQFLYHYLNSLPRFSAERFFLPDRTSCDVASLRGLVSEESGRPLRDFRLIAFSIPFENDYPAVPAILGSAGIPPLQEDRGRDDPVVIAGGVAVSINPEPLSAFMDLIHIGELDDEPDHDRPVFFERAADLLESSRQVLGDRKEFLKHFRNIPSVYVPSAYRFEVRQDGLIESVQPGDGFPAVVPAGKRRSKDASVPVSVLFSPDTEFGDSLLVETNRGCSRGCRFCAAGWTHFPVRYRLFERFKGPVDAALDAGRTVGLIGSDLAGHPELEEILAYIVKKGGRFSLSSIRPEGLSPAVIELMAANGQKTATLAPEVASARLKQLIGKGIPAERFYELVERLVAGGIPNIRLYFMIGLPGETDADAQQISAFVLRCREIFVDASRPMRRIGRIGVQVNPFVPKPWTPFQWAAMSAPADLQRRMELLRRTLKKASNVTLRAESVKQARLQACLSRGDRRLATALMKTAERGRSWVSAFREEAVNIDFYAHRERLPDEIFPWEVTDHGISKAALYRVYAKSFLRPESPGTEDP